MKINRNRKRIFLSPPHMSGKEEQFISDAFKSNYIAPTGPMVDQFEKEFAQIAGSRYALAVSSGTAAMHLALRVLNISNDDVVIASTLTFIGSVSPVTFVGAEPCFIDSDTVSWNMNPELLADALKDLNSQNRLPKVVVPTDIYGQSSDIGRIKNICEEFGVPVISDAAEALGATYGGKPAGSYAFAAVHSFNGNKIITTSGGGMLTSDNQRFIEKARFYSQQARENYAHYEHNEIGYNYRMSNILAAIGLGQLSALEDRVLRKRQIFQQYKMLLGGNDGITFMPIAGFGEPNYWLTVILIDKQKYGNDREAVRLELESQNIESRPIWKPMHLQPVFANARIYGGEFSKKLFNEGLCLPSGTAMSDDDIHHISEIILGCRQ